MLIGRAAEQASIAATLTAAHRGNAPGLIVRGEPGSGRTALLAHAKRAAQELGFVSLSTTCRPTDTGNAFAGVGALLRPLESTFASLPTPLYSALEVAVGNLRQPMEAHEVGWAVHRVIAALADTQPVLVTIDNAMWLDESSLRAISFAAARFVAEPIAIVMSSDTQWATPRELAGALSEINIAQMSKSELVALLYQSGMIDVSDAAFDACISRTGSNPLGMIELVRSLNEDERIGISPIPAIPKPSDAITLGFGRRIAELDTATRRALVVIAADDTGDLSTVTAALAMLGEPATELELAEHASIVEVIGDKVRFTHELLRAVAYHQVERKSRQAAHLALGTVLDKPQDAQARARHLGAAADGPNTSAADALALVAQQAERRGAAAEAATAYVQSARLTPDASQRNLRNVHAARQWIASGQPELALSLLDLGDTPSQIDPRALTLLVAATGLTHGAVQAGILAAGYTMEPSSQTHGDADGSAGFDATETRWLALALAADEYRRAGLHDRRDFALAELANATGWPLAMRDAMQGFTSGVVPMYPPFDRLHPAHDLLERRFIVCAGETLLAQHRFEEATAMSNAVAFSADPVDAYVLEIAGIRARAAIGLQPASAASARSAFAVLIDAAGGAPQRALSAAVALLHALNGQSSAPHDADLVQDPLTALSKAERRVADAVGSGQTNRQAADALYLSVKTIDFHLQQIYRKLDLRSRAELAVLVTRSIGAQR